MQRLHPRPECSLHLGRVFSFFMSETKVPSVAELVARCSDTDLPPAVDLQGWNSDHPIFDRLVEEVRPRTIIEVGTWKGRSALHLAVASAGLTVLDDVSGAAVAAPSRIYCVDTWQGGIDHVLSDQPQDAIPRDAAGSPRLYHQFMRNVSAEPDLARRIHPIVNTSLNGARLLAHLGVSAELIYVDGSHEYQDAYTDLCAYVQLLTEGGVMFGDDFRFPGVFPAVIRFAHEYGRKVEEIDRNFWILRPTA